MGRLDYEAAVRKAAQMIRGIKVAMLTSSAPDGTLHSRPMATQDVNFDGTLWFFTKAGSGKVEEILEDSDVAVSYTSHEEHRYVSLSGRASLVADPDRMRDLWQPSYRIWFAKGLQDPELALIRVEVRSLRYWDMLTGGMVEQTLAEPVRLGA